MKVAILSGANSIHTIRWANGLHAAGHEVHVISQQPLIEPFAPGVQVHLFPFRAVLGYFTMVPGVRRLLHHLEPDIVNAHYASGYGTTARLVGRRPWVLSVWGSDVYDFPYKSPIHKWGVVANLNSADAVASTSHCMAKQTRSLAPDLGEIAITPFGVDCRHFSPGVPANIAAPGAPVVIGTVKALTSNYGIDLLITAFAMARRSLMQTDTELAMRMRLRIVGEGPDRTVLEQLTSAQGVADVVEFVGRVSHVQVPQVLRSLDIFVALSRLESFGVAAIEAGAVGLPVVVSDAGGLPEVVLHAQTGLVVPKENAQAAADAIVQLVQSRDFRVQLGAQGRLHVQTHYDWNTCLEKMLSVYCQVINKHARKTTE